MDLRVRSLGGVTVLELAGDILGQPAELDSFRNAIEDLIDEGKRKVVVNMSKVGWISSVGVGIILSGFLILQKADGELVVAEPSRKVDKLLHVLNLHSTIKIFEEERQAVAYFEDSDRAAGEKSEGVGAR